MVSSSQSLGLASSCTFLCPSCANRIESPMPVIKPTLLEQFYQRTATTEQAFAMRCRVSRQTLRNASTGLNVRPKVAGAIASGMGFLPQETCMLYEDNHTLSTDELVELSLQRLGLGLW